MSSSSIVTCQEEAGEGDEVGKAGRERERADSGD